ncbi:hypothetical protein CVT24_001712 [Panaeolus cyanescens]|uniref:Uncharacterized protein n=1 Tax=Panaeolus cyanescens TaxID=181874 RepID=A0A409YFN6_9AGAR|nr:hypothetical protein CVT24_001712 [Panaeolus cyanescens]
MCTCFSSPYYLHDVYLVPPPKCAQIPGSQSYTDSTRVIYRNTNSSLPSSLPGSVSPSASSSPPSSPPSSAAAATPSTAHYHSNNSLALPVLSSSMNTRKPLRSSPLAGPPALFNSESSDSEVDSSDFDGPGSRSPNPYSSTATSPTDSTFGFISNTSSCSISEGEVATTGLMFSTKSEKRRMVRLKLPAECHLHPRVSVAQQRGGPEMPMMGTTVCTCSSTPRLPTSAAATPKKKSNTGVLKKKRPSVSPTSAVFGDPHQNANIKEPVMLSPPLRSFASRSRESLGLGSGELKDSVDGGGVGKGDVDRVGVGAGGSSGAEGLGWSDRSRTGAGTGTGGLLSASLSGSGISEKGRVRALGPRPLPISTLRDRPVSAQVQVVAEGESRRRKEEWETVESEHQNLYMKSTKSNSNGYGYGQRRMTMMELSTGARGGDVYGDIRFKKSSENLKPPVARGGGNRAGHEWEEFGVLRTAGTYNQPLLPSPLSDGRDADPKTRRRSMGNMLPPSSNINKLAVSTSSIPTSNGFLSPPSTPPSKRLSASISQSQSLSSSYSSPRSMSYSPSSSSPLSLSSSTSSPLSFLPPYTTRPHTPPTPTPDPYQKSKRVVSTSNSWYTAQPWGEIPKFTRLGLAAPGVVLPIPAKEHWRLKRGISGGSMNGSTSSRQSSVGHGSIGSGGAMSMRSLSNSSSSSCVPISPPQTPSKASESPRITRISEANESEENDNCVNSTEGNGNDDEVERETLSRSSSASAATSMSTSSASSSACWSACTTATTTTMMSPSSTSEGDLSVGGGSIPDAWAKKKSQVVVVDNDATVKQVNVNETKHKRRRSLGIIKGLGLGGGGAGGGSFAAALSPPSSPPHHHHLGAEPRLGGRFTLSEVTLTTADKNHKGDFNPNLPVKKWWRTLVGARER